MLIKLLILFKVILVVIQWKQKQSKGILVKEAEQIKKDNIYQAFYPLKLLENHQNNSFTVEGLLKTMTGNIAMEEKKAE